MHEPPVQVAHPNSWWVPVACDVPTMTDFILKCCVRLWTDPAGSPWQLQSTFHWLWQPRGATFGARSDNSLSRNQFGRCLSSHSFIGGGGCLVEATEQYDPAERHRQSNQWCHDGDDLCCSALIVFYIRQLQCILRRSKQVHGSLSLSDWPGWLIAWFPPAPKWNRIWETHVTVMTMQTKRGGRAWQQSAWHSIAWCCDSNLCHCETEMHLYGIIFYYQTKTVEPAILSIMRARSAVTTFLYVNSFECLGHCVFSFFCAAAAAKRTWNGFQNVGFGPSSSLVLFQQSVKWNGTWQASAIFIKTTTIIPVVLCKGFIHNDREPNGWWFKSNPGGGIVNYLFFLGRQKFRDINQGDVSCLCASLNKMNTENVWATVRKGLGEWGLDHTCASFCIQFN